MHAYIHTKYIHTYKVHTYLHTCIHAYTHTHTHTHTHMILTHSTAQVGTLMMEMEDEADRVRAQIEAALLDTTFSPSSAMVTVQTDPPDPYGGQSFLDL